MKAAYLALALLALPTSARAAEIDPATIQLWDVVYTTEGNVLKGVIVEQVPGESLKILLVGGSSLVVPIATVVRFGKELNPGFGTAPAAQVVARPAEPATKATSGLRIGVMPGLANHTEGETTFWLTSRVGWEIGLGQWGLTPGLVAELMPEVGTYGEAAGSLSAAARAAYRGSTISPFVGFGVGVDAVAGDVTPAIFMGGGIDLVLHRRFALSAEAKFHRGFGNQYTQALSYAAIGFGVEVRL